MVFLKDLNLFYLRELDENFLEKSSCYISTALSRFGSDVSVLSNIHSEAATGGVL